MCILYLFSFCWFLFYSSVFDDVRVWEIDVISFCLWS